MASANKPGRFAEARVPVSLVSLFFLSWAIYDAVSRQLWFALAVWLVLLIVVLVWLIVPEVRKRR